MNHVDIDTTAKIVGLSPNELFSLTSQGIPHTVIDDECFFDLFKAVPWFIRSKRGQTALSRMKLYEAQIKKTNAQTRMLQHNLQVKKKLLIRASDVEKLWSHVLTTFRAKVLNIPKAVAPLLDSLETPNDLEELLVEHLHAALEELSNLDFELIDEKESD